MQSPPSSIHRSIPLLVRYRIAGRIAGDLVTGCGAAAAYLAFFATQVRGPWWELSAYAVAGAVSGVFGSVTQKRTADFVWAVVLAALAWITHWAWAHVTGNIGVVSSKLVGACAGAASTAGLVTFFTRWLPVRGARFVVVSIHGHADPTEPAEQVSAKILNSLHDLGPLESEISAETTEGTWQFGVAIGPSVRSSRLMKSVLRRFDANWRFKWSYGLRCAYSNAVAARDIKSCIQWMSVEIREPNPAFC